MYNLSTNKQFDMSLKIPSFSIRYAILQNSNKRNVVYIKEIFENSTFRYRTYNFMEAMEKSDKYCITCFMTEELYYVYELLDKIDLIILQRARWNAEIENFVKIAKKNKIVIIYDIDDLIYHTKYVPQFLNSLGNFNDTSIDSFFSLAKRCEILAELSDGFLATTYPLKKHMEEDFKKPTWVFHNFLNKEQENESRIVVQQKKTIAEGKQFLIGYFSGSDTHKRDLEIVEPAILQLMKKYNDINLKIVGYMQLSDEFRKLQKEKRITVDHFVSFQELQYKMGEVDLNIIPLQKHEFNDCKSELKFLDQQLSMSLVSLQIITFIKA